MIFAITDIETTGSYAAANGITEIAVVLTDGTKIIDEFQTLLRPEHPIPAFITELTGITNEMVADAPRFEEIAQELYSWFEEAVFVAHNVGFDYAFIKKSFEEYGLRFTPKRLCTVRLSRKILPGHNSYSLGRICEDLGIVNKAAHRAMGDTMATVQLFHHLVAKDQGGIIDKMIKHGSSDQWLPPSLSASTFDHLPEKPGVYYFLNKEGRYLYIGMSVNVKKRIRQHFGGKMDSSRRQEFLRDITDIHVTETGSELIARLLEDAEIRQHWPPHNRAQKRPKSRYGIVEYMDREGYKRLSIEKLKASTSAIEVWHSPSAARERLFAMAREFEIHLSLCSLPGAMGEIPSVQEHNEKVLALKTSITQRRNAVTIIEDRGRTSQENSFIFMEGDSLVGYGYFDQHEAIDNLASIRDRIIRLPESEMTASIISHHRPTSKVWHIDLSEEG